MLNFGIDEEGRYLNTIGINMLDTFADIWSRCVTKHDLPGRFINTSFPQYYRTVEEFCAPFKDNDSPVYKAGLRLVSAKTGVVGCPYRRAFDEAGSAMSAREFAKNYVPTLRSWSEAVFLSGLDDARPADERHQIVDAFYQRKGSSSLRPQRSRHGLRALLSSS